MTQPVEGPSSAPPVELSRRRVFVIFGALLAAMFLSSLDQSVVGTALPTIVGDLGAAQNEGWIITAYLLAIAIVMPIYGKLGDLVGRRIPFLVAIALFVVGSTGSALAGSFVDLILWRSVQGLGAGGLVILAQAVIADIVSARERGKYMGPMGAVFGVATVTGPLLGGWFTQGPGWRWCFWTNVPIGLIALGVAWFALKLPSHRPAHRFDLGGALLLATATAGVVFLTSWTSLTGAAGYDWGDPGLLALTAGTLLAVAGFLVVESRVSDPIVPLRLFHSSTFAVAAIIALSIGMAMFAALSFLPTFLQMAQGVGATESGLLMLPMTIGILITSLASGLLITRTGHYKLYPIVGMGVATAALAWLTLISAGMSMVLFGAMIFVLGLGLGAVLQTIVIAAQNSVPATQVGVATSTNNFLREIGAAVGTSAFSTAFTTRLSTTLAEDMRQLPASDVPAAFGARSLTPADVASLPASVREAVVEAYTTSLAPSFWYLVPVAAVGFIAAFFMREIRLSDRAGLSARASS
ncbi:MULTISPECIES: MDR family MFS transporter [Microbacterium]|uniref:DHA2 family efflux MFS transporter permease subunit n=1 Tax=Microbacterium wangchenii TaxID=2541726 RepID=A0ABX5SUF4_9MICO|nr:MULTISPECIES: MDR family MFS transporter [Microbacterium]MCK6067262.1 MFS transporter [Microbacterium sp. EYE_512]QBR89791.1 DHA2 family efflux MFS transporter permease subunit [Microbacterium wangchenii]TXK16611.1 MFS transporter [Microbacterium wangchenii]